MGQPGDGGSLLLSCWLLKSFAFSIGQMQSQRQQDLSWAHARHQEQFPWKTHGAFQLKAHSCSTSLHFLNEPLMLCRVRCAMTFGCAQTSVQCRDQQPNDNMHDINRVRRLAEVKYPECVPAASNWLYHVS